MKCARLLPQHYHSYPPDYRRQWFPVLDRHPVTGVEPMAGYLWIQTPWRVQAIWAEHLELEERELC
jgi:hypothetical protein